VVLVGDGSLDFHDYLGTGERNGVPPYLAQVDPWLGETASDNRYAAVLGDDALPDLFIGRLPVGTPAEARGAIAKLLRYADRPEPGPWRGRALLVADDPDVDGDYPALAERSVVPLATAGVAADRVFLGRTHTDATAARADIMARLTAGRWLVTYHGHGALPWWAQESLLTVADWAAVPNGPRLPFVLPLTCFDGIFDYPGQPSMSEVAVRSAAGGAVAAFAPTGESLSAHQVVLENGLLDALLVRRERRLGPAILQAQLALWATDTASYLVDTYGLLGDPATELVDPAPGTTLWLPWLARGLWQGRP
jgi:hypothetical protein